MKVTVLPQFKKAPVPLKKMPVFPQVKKAPVLPPNQKERDYEEDFMNEEIVEDLATAKPPVKYTPVGKNNPKINWIPSDATNDWSK